MKAITFPLDTIFIVAFTKFLGDAKSIFPDLIHKETNDGELVTIELSGIDEDKIEKVINAANQYLNLFKK